MRNYTMGELSVESLEELEKLFSSGVWNDDNIFLTRTINQPTDPSQIDYLSHFQYHIIKSCIWLARAWLSRNLKFIDYARKEVFHAYHQDRVLIDQKLRDFAKCVLGYIAYVEKTIGENPGGDIEMRETKQGQKPYQCPLKKEALQNV